MDDAVGCPTIRSDISKIEDWVTNSDSYDMKKNTQCSPTPYPLKQILVSDNNSKFLLLISAVNDNNMLGCKGGAINDIQKLDIASISGRSYY